MGRFRRDMYEAYAAEYSREFSSDENYNKAYKKVKKIKGFYSHLKAYLVVNAIIIISGVTRNSVIGGFDFSSLSEWHTYSTAFFWGIGIAVHALSVFSSDWFFGADWEEKKIQKYMDKQSENKNKWE